jgi:hypothetical protein
MTAIPLPRGWTRTVRSGVVHGGCLPLALANCFFAESNLYPRYVRRERHVHTAIPASTPARTEHRPASPPGSTWFQVATVEVITRSILATLPRRLPLALWSRFDPMVAEDVADGRIGDRVPQVGQRTFDAIVAPAWILAGHAEDQFNDFHRHTRASNFLAPVAVVPFLCNKLAMPAQDRVWRNNVGDLSEHLAPDDLPFDSQASPLVVVEPDALLAVCFSQDLILGPQVLNDLLLLPVDPAG